MNRQPNRKAIWISTVLTVAVMGVASLFLFGPTHLFAASQRSQTAAAQIGTSSAAAAMTSADDAAVIAAYQSQLDQSYAALQDAYTQIQMLQQALAQSQGQLRRFGGDDRGRTTLPQTGLNGFGG
jgi:hypothetical protein